MNAVRSWLVFIRRIWQEIAMFAERFVLTVLAGLLLALIVTNPMNFDWAQRISGSIAIIATAYFIAHTVTKKNSSQGSEVPKTASVKTDELEQEPSSVAAKLKSPEERNKLQEKYRWGYRIYGLDKWGGNESYSNRFSEEYDMDWNAVKMTTNAVTGKFEVTYPSFTLKNKNVKISGGAVSGPIRLGEFGGGAINGVAVSVEILEITQGGIIYLVGVNEDPAFEAQRLLRQKIKTAEPVIVRHYDLYSRGLFNEIWNEAHPDFRAAQDRRTFDATMAKVQEKFGKFISTEAARRYADPANVSSRIQIEQRTKYEKLECLETFTIIISGGTALLYGISEVEIIPQPASNGN